MSKSKHSGISIIGRILLAIIVIILVFGTVGMVFILLIGSQEEDVNQYIYIEYAGVTYSEENGADGITIAYGKTLSFTIGNTASWGEYSVQDCTVMIVPNLDDEHNFEFTVDGNHKSSVYSSVTDLTAAFSVDGSGIDISPSGEFSIFVKSCDMADILGAVYGEITAIDGDYYLFDYPYIAVELTSPDGADTLTMPLLVDIDGVVVEGLEFDVEGIIL